MNSQSNSLIVKSLSIILSVCLLSTTCSCIVPNGSQTVFVSAKDFVDPGFDRKLFDLLKEAMLVSSDVEIGKARKKVIQYWKDNYPMSTIYVALYGIEKAEETPGFPAFPIFPYQVFLLLVGDSAAEAQSGLGYALSETPFDDEELLGWLERNLLQSSFKGMGTVLDRHSSYIVNEEGKQAGVRLYYVAMVRELFTDWGQGDIRKYIVKIPSLSASRYFDMMDNPLDRKKVLPDEWNVEDITQNLGPLLIAKKLRFAETTQLEERFVNALILTINRSPNFKEKEQLEYLVGLLRRNHILSEAAVATLEARFAKP